MHAVYELTWPDSHTSTVEIDLSGPKVVAVKISGPQKVLAALREPRTEAEIDITLRRLAMHEGIRVVKVQRGR